MALLKFKRSAVPAKVPALNDLALGELAINTYDGKVYTKKDDGTPAIVEIGGNSSGITTITSTDGSVTVTGSGATRDLSVAVAGSTTNVVALVRNNTGATLAKGTVVYINGSVGQNSTVAKAIANSDATSAQTLGLMTANLANNATGYVTVIGVLTGMDTSAFTDGQQLYLSPTTAGTFTATKPYAPQHLVYVAVVEHAHPTQGKLFVKVQNGYEMDELHDVSAQNPANNDGLFYNTTSGLWEKKSIATALGYTPVNRAGDAFTGPIYFQSPAGNSGFINGTGDGASLSTYNFALQGWNGMAFYNPTVGGAFPNATSGFVDFRNGILSMRGDVRAPIFYDSPNSAYYLDPAGTSNLSGVTLDGTLTGVTGRFAKNQTAGNYTTAALWTESYGNTTTGIAFHISGVVGKFLEMRTDQILYWSGIMNADGEFRAPIFRDMNNSAYFLDPSETSQLKTVEVSGGIGFRTFSNGSSSVNSQFYFANAANSRAWNWQLDENNDAALWNYQGSSWNKRFTFTAGSNFTAGGNIGANAGIFTNDGASRVLYLKGSGNIIQFQDADGTNRWENVGRNGTYYVYKGYGVGEGFKWQIDDNGNHIFNGIATFNTEIRSPIFRDSSNTGFYVDPNSISVLDKLTAGQRSLVGYAQISMAGLDVNTYYPVTIPVPIARQGTLRIENALNSNAPSWSTHPSGFSCYFEWTTNGLGWGTIPISRRVTDWRESFTSVQIVGGIDQMTFSSQEVIWLRGGGNYFLSADFDVAPTIRTTSYELYGQTVAPRSSIYNNPRDTAQGRVAFGSLQTNEQSLFRGNIDISTGSPQIVFSSTTSGRAASFGMTDAYNMYLNAPSNGVLYLSEFRAPMFRDTDDSAYYVDPASGSNLAGQVQIVGGATMSGGWNRSLYLAATYPVIVMNSANAKISGIGVDYTEAQSGMVFWVNGNSADLTNGSATAALRINTGNFVSASGEFRAPIFRDSDNTAYFIDPSSHSGVRAAYLNGNILINPQSESYGEGIAFLMPSQGTWGGLRWKRSNSDFTGAWAFGYFGNETNNDIGFHNGTNGWRLDHSFNMSVNGSVNAPIFRDLTNTGYYWDIADGAVSSVNTQIVGFAYFRSNFGNNVYSGSVASPPLQAYSNDGSTAMMSFHRAGAYAVNMGLDPDNVLRIGGWSASANRFQMDMSGNLTMAGNVTAYSDGRLKEDVATVVNALDLVGKMRGVTYTRKDTGEAGVGVIAQEMLEVLPEVVQQGIGDDDTLSVAYGNLVGVLIEAIKELSLKVKTLEEKDNSI